MKRKMTGTKRKITRTMKTTKPEKHMGLAGNGGPFSLMQLKIIQEVITLVVFIVFSTLFFKGESLQWNHLAACVCLVMAVYFVFMK